MRFRQYQSILGCAASITEAAQNLAETEADEADVIFNQAGQLLATATVSAKKNPWPWIIGAATLVFLLRR